MNELLKLANEGWSGNLKPNLLFKYYGIDQPEGEIEVMVWKTLTNSDGLKLLI